jgi:hypothetical protein
MTEPLTRPKRKNPVLRTRQATLPPVPRGCGFAPCSTVPATPR